MGHGSRRKRGQICLYIIDTYLNLQIFGDDKMKYKGQLIGRGQEIVMLMVFGGILLGAGALAMAGLNTAALASLGSGNASTVATIGNSSSALVQFSTQLPTIGIIGGISLLILVLFIGFGAFLGGRK
jgi:hypothetical protein